MEKLRQKIVAFITSEKDAPLLAGLVLGVYLLTYYYSKNISLANSWIQLAFFTAYYILLPVFILFVGYTLTSLINRGRYKKHFLFIVIPLLFSFYVLQLSWIGEWKRPIFGGVILVAGLLSLKWAHYYKIFIVLVAFMALFNLPPIVNTAYVAATASDAWRNQPDAITSATFRQRPNIYYIQPDGYASFSNLKDSLHNFDNSKFENYLAQKGFTLYNNFRSNYFSTLLSNSSMFSMKHHYVPEDIDTYGARNVITGENAVIKTLKNNGYTTHLITDRPYLLMNRPNLAYDYCNITYESLPFIKDGWQDVRDVNQALSKAYKPGDGNFYFIERMLPSHIASRDIFSSGAAAEKTDYFKRLQESNTWLEGTVNFITKKDPEAIIIIAADHGGFVGLDYTLQSLNSLDNPALVKSVFGAMAAIKWNSKAHSEYDSQLKTSVNLFRVLFAFLAKDKSYLNNMQEDSSYIKMDNPKGLYCRIDDKGNVVMQKKE